MNSRSAVAAPAGQGGAPASGSPPVGALQAVRGTAKHAANGIRQPVKELGDGMTPFRYVVLIRRGRESLESSLGFRCGHVEPTANFVPATALLAGCGDESEHRFG